MAENSTTPPPYGGPQSGFAGRGTRFFEWTRSLGVIRSDGWIGGVCAGLANRIGVDPLIVRGIVVVAAIVGAPMLLLYAIAWALLPDREGRIHLQRLFDGAFEAPIVAIGVLLVLSLLPWASGGWWLGGPFGHGPDWGDVVGRLFWTLLVLGAAAALVIIAVRNADRRSGAGSFPIADPGATTPTTGAADATGATTEQQDSPAEATTVAAATSPIPSVPAPVLDTATEPAAPPAPTIGATEQDLADWRARQAQWKADHARWKQRLAEDMRAVKAQRSAEVRAQAAAASADAEARRAAYRRANPRVGAAIGWLAIGLALAAGALTSALWGPLSGLPGYALAAALAAATLVFGITVLIAGLTRRRSGFLIFLGILLAVFTGIAALLPTVPHASIDTGALTGRPLNVTPSESANYVQGWGATTIDLSDAVTAPGVPIIDLAKTGGPTTILVPSDATVRVTAITPTELTVGSGLTERESLRTAQTCATLNDGPCARSVLVGTDDSPDAVVRVLQADDVVIERTKN